tara:strand:+ start:4450 stop:4821 length:372 start_codon:yes stop_codon:yes gene_type:complete
MTKNFNISEFNSKDGSKMPSDVFLNMIKLANQLQILRDYTGRAITVNSGYRSPKHNAKIGGSLSSQHLLGKAADITIEALKPSEVYMIIDELIDMGLMLQGGLGLYEKKGFVHYDIRKNKARW